MRPPSSKDHDPHGGPSYDGCLNIPKTGGPADALAFASRRGLLRPVSKKPAKPRSRSVFRAIGAPFLFFRRLLRCRVTLKREGKNLNVVLVPDEPDAPLEETIDKDAEALRLLRADLKSLLDAHPMTRRMVARHLAAFERALAKHGMNALNLSLIHI